MQMSDLGQRVESVVDSAAFLALVKAGWTEPMAYGWEMGVRRLFGF
jgi:hypothetical protein